MTVLGPKRLLVVLRALEQVANGSSVGLTSFDAVVLVHVGIIVDDLEVCMHPFGEHSVCSGQHPPPVSSKHCTVNGKHFGGSALVEWQSDICAVELQHTIFDGVNGVG